MPSFQQALDYPFHTGIGPYILARDNSTAYPYFLGAIALALVITIIGVIRYHTWSALGGQIAALFAISLPLSLVWLALAWPIGSFPFWAPPPPTDLWFGALPVLSLYMLLVITVHYLLIFVAGYGVGCVWGLQSSLTLVTSDTEKDSRNASANNSSGDLREGITTLFGLPAFYALALLGETRMLSPYVNVIVELVILFATGWAMEYLLNYATRHRFVRLISALIYLLFIIGLLLIIYTHPLGIQVAQVGLLYLALIWLDNVVAAAWEAIVWENAGSARLSRLLSRLRIGESQISQEEGNEEMLSPRRWIVTLVVVLAVTMLGASRTIHLWPGLKTLAPVVWTHAGVAAAAFLVFNPLVALARYLAGAPERDENSSSLERLLFAGKHNLQNNWLFAPAPEIPPANTEEQAAATTQYPQENIEELLIFDHLFFPAGALFFVLLIGYHLILPLIQPVRLGVTFNDNSFSINNALLVSFVFGLITLIAGILNLLNNRVIKSAIPAFLLIVFVISGVAAVTTLGALIPAITKSPDLELFFVLLQELLVFLTIGWLAFIYQVINASVTADLLLTRKNEKQARNDARFEQAYKRYKSKEYQLAVADFDDVLNHNPDNADALCLRGFCQASADKNAEALADITGAIELARGARSPYSDRLWDYYDTRGRLYMKLNQYEQACEDFRASIEEYAYDSRDPAQTKKRRQRTKREYEKALHKCGHTDDDILRIMDDL